MLPDLYYLAEDIVSTITGDDEFVDKTATDIAAVEQWLKARANRSEHTFLAYKKEAERILSWSFSHGKTLADLTESDISRFLDDIAEQYGLNPDTVAYSRRIVSQLFGYLTAKGHLSRNVVWLTPAPVTFEEEEPIRYLDLDAWTWLWDWLVSRPAEKQHIANLNNRARWLFALIYHTGMRREEVAKASMSDFMYRQGRWILKVIGKRRKIRYVSVNSVLLQELKRYRLYQNLPEMPEAGENYGVIIPMKGDKHRRITPRAIGMMVHDCKEQALIQCTDPHIYQQLENMSTHWLRHTNTTHRYMAGASLETIQDEQGHADPKTTRIYLKTVPGKRQEDAEKLAEMHLRNATKNTVDI